MEQDTNKETEDKKQEPQCGYCGSTKEPISQEEMYGPGVTGWPCCPDCGGV